MSGLLLGILLARTASSLLAAVWGWRSVYLVSAVLMLGMALVLRRVLPEYSPDHSAGYRQLMVSVGQLARDEPALRRRAVCQALMFATFSVFWTSITYELIRAHHLSQAGIGVFALVGAGGALAAPVAGRLADRGYGRIASGLVFVLAIGAMALAGLAARNLLLLALAGVLLDLAVQGHQVLSQQEIYSLRPDARARINTVFMGTVFLGGSLGSAASGALYERYGWAGPTVLGVLLGCCGLAVWCGSELLRRRSGQLT